MSQALITRETEELLASALDSRDAASEITSVVNSTAYRVFDDTASGSTQHTAEYTTTDGTLVNAIVLPMEPDSYAYCEILWLRHDQTVGGAGAMQKSWATFSRLGSADAVVDNLGIFVGSNNDGIPGATFVDVSGANLVVQLQGDDTTFDTLEWKVFVTVWTLNF